MRLTLFLAIILLFTKAFSQEEAFNMSFSNQSLGIVLDTIEEKFNVIFSYDYSIIIEHKKITLKKKTYDLQKLLIQLERLTDLSFSKISKRYIVIKKKDDPEKYFNILNLVVVRSYIATGIEKNNNGSYTINPDKLKILPGLTEPDVLESIQLLPGVISPNETATGFFVRGGFSDQNRLVWDGINLYHKGHLFGMISPINPNIASNIQFINKGSHPKYGERLSSVIDITSKSEIPDKFKAEIGLNGLNFDGLIEVPILKNKLSLIASLRTSYTGILETTAFNQLSKKVFESTKISESEQGENKFNFNDFNFKMNFKPNKHNRLYASVIGIENTLNYLLDEVGQNMRFNDILTISNFGYSAGWKKQWTPKLSQNFQAFFSDYSLNYNFITAEDETVVSDFEKRNTIFDSGVSLEFDYRPSKRFDHSFGYQYTLKDVAYAFINTSDLTFVLDTEDETVQTHSAFYNLGYSNSKLFDFSLGVRSTYFRELDAVRFEPRVQISKPITSKISINSTVEFKNQIINELDETVFSDLSLENNVWQLANGDDIPIKNSLQTSLGGIYTVSGFSLDVDAYYKRLNNVSALALGFLNPDNVGFNIGEQSIFGVDVFMKKRIHAFNAWVSYSFNNARNRFENINNEKSFRSNSNVTHAVSTSLSYSVSDFNFSMGWRWQTGRPYTVADSNIETLTFNTGINTGNLPNYHRLDLSGTYNFNFSNSGKLKGKVGFSIRNLYNRRALISIEYRGNNNINDSIEVIDRFSLGITPNLMFRLFW